MNQQDNTPASPARLRDTVVATAAQLLPAAEFGLRVAVLAGVVIGAGLAADLGSPIEALGGEPNTTCCIIIDQQ